MGHWLTTESAKSKRRYLASSQKQYPFEALVNAIRNLKYQELDLSHFDAHYRCGATIRVRERDDQGERSDRGEAIMPVLIDAGKGHGCG